MPISPNYRNIHIDETKLYTICLKSFKNQRLYLEQNLNNLWNNHITDIFTEYEYLLSQLNLYPKKDFNLWLEWFWRWMWINDMIEESKNPIIKSCNKWYKKRFRLFQPILTETWIRINKNLANQYATLRWNLELSDFKWTITHTTKFNVIKILKEWLENNLTINDIQNEINKLNEKLFSPARARSIAITEIWKAYEYWNYQPIKELSESWVQIKKLWLTCRDVKVRPEHMECEELWWVDLDFEYPSVWTKIPPWWVNCRCTMEYDFEL